MQLNHRVESAICLGWTLKTTSKHGLLLRQHTIEKPAVSCHKLRCNCDFQVKTSNYHRRTSPFQCSLLWHGITAQTEELYVSVCTCMKDAGGESTLRFAVVRLLWLEAVQEADWNTVPSARGQILHSIFSQRPDEDELHTHKDTQTTDQCHTQRKKHKYSISLSKSQEHSTYLVLHQFYTNYLHTFQDISMWYSPLNTSHVWY